MIMNKSNEHDIIKLEQFIEATRDSGYKSTASSIAELIDNSFEAGATDIEIDFTESPTRQIQVSVRDNGCGMTPSVLRLALRFGGSTRFNSRKGTGRYGMGLPNSSLSRARRVDVYTWRKPRVVWWSYLDVDEVTSGKITSVPKPKRQKFTSSNKPKRSRSGTVVVWSQCDRLDYKNLKKLMSKLSKSLGQTFRREIWRGKCIRINGAYVCPVDPMFLRKGNNLHGAVRYGVPMNFEIRIPQIVGDGSSLSTVRVTFSELPIETWHHFSNEEKRIHGITKGAGVSIVRSGREIDYGWFFMGSKRKENYDDWWRCEIHFDAELDELFGVTHTKQGIHPTGILKTILSPDIERVAHILNSRVRERYLKVRSVTPRSTAIYRAESRDHLLEPPAKSRLRKGEWKSGSARAINNGGVISGFAYRIEHKALDEPSFFVPLPSSSELIVLLNEEHPFYERVYHPIVDARDIEVRSLHGYLELLLFAAARAECSVTSSQKIKWARSMRESWSKTLATFLD
ncbi:MAG: hypothetical protein QOE96_2401 [Blastocatellia bacterium]|nr:hypothetical protein [Blastocatellia bacterium]